MLLLFHFIICPAFDDGRIQFSSSSSVSLDLCTYGAEVCVFCDVLGDTIVSG